MPRPHYPSQGGLHHRYGTTGPSQGTERKKSAVRKSDADRQALEEEIERLRRELARAQRNDAGSRSASETTRLLRAVLLLCGGGLVFAIVALLRHG